MQYNNSPNDVIDSSSEASSASISTPTFSPISSSDHEFRSPEQNDQDRTNDKDKTYDKDNSILAISVSSFKLVGDNVDKSSKPRHETSESHTQSLHYFHSYAVKDRCDIEGLDDSVSLPVVEDVDVTKLLPTNEDLKCLQKNINILIARTVMKHCTFFQEKIQSLEHHIPHPFSKQMSQKSDVVSKSVVVYMHVTCYYVILNYVLSIFSLISIVSFGCATKERGETRRHGEHYESSATIRACQVRGNSNPGDNK